MKKISPLVAFFLAAIIATGQGPARGEFATNSNGLMYSDGDIKALRFIVDSLNLKFKSCEPNQQYFSMPQGRFYYARFTDEKNDLRSIVADIDKISFHELVSKHRPFLRSCDTTSILIKGKTYYLSGTAEHGYESQNFGGGRKTTGEIKEGNWLFIYETPQQYTNYYEIFCYYFPEKLQSKSIPKEYASLIQYVDCMVDTTSVVFKPLIKTAGNTGEYSEIHKKVNDYINSSLKIKNRGDDRWIYNRISSEKAERAIEKLSGDDYFRRIVVELNEAAQSIGAVSDGEEKLIAHFVSPNDALALKRSRRVVGMCSQDQSPRIHAREIALLSAQAHSWDIFLRAHLDIMHDRFDRMTDGSYAWGQRKTYLKELETLDLNVVDLMLGLSLRASNVANNHYYGTIWRTAWALSESKDKDLFEQKALTMIKDNRLDDFNRGLIFMLYQIYTNYLEKDAGNQKRDELRKHINEYPDFLQDAIRDMKVLTGKDRN